MNPTMGGDYEKPVDLIDDAVRASEGGKTDTDSTSREPSSSNDKDAIESVVANATAAATTTTEGVVPSPADRPDRGFQTDYRFWMIMLTLCFSVLLASLESTVVITSLPTIVAELKIGSNYIWVTNVFLLASTAVQPIFGQMCNLFGRKSVLIFVFAAYTVGSGIAGGANEEIMLIAGRAIQGVGSGGLNMAADVVVSDLVPLRYRGNYIALLLIVGTLGFSIGPFVGGVIVERANWRWVFWLNIPVGVVGIIVAYFFLNLRWNREEAIAAKLKRIDYVGNLILIASTVSVLIALTWAGPIYEWSDYHILTPLIVGIAGLVGFACYEASGLPMEPVMPLRLFPNRTARIVYINTFLNSVLIFWTFFFFPLYFQAVQLSSPARSGVQILPVTLISVPSAAVSAVLLTKFGKFKILHCLGFTLQGSGIALLAVLRKDSPTYVWVLLQIVPAIGSGLLINTMLPAFQASLAEADQAAATATWSFIRTFGQVWGIAVAGAVFNSYTGTFAREMISDPAVREILSNGDAYASATRDFVTQFPEPLQTQIRDVFLKALRNVYLISIAFGGTALVMALFEKNVPLRKALDTEYGLEEKIKESKKQPDGDVA